MSERMEVFPFAPRDWVSDSSDRIAQVKAVYEGDPGEVLLDLVYYDRSGERLGRVSPPEGGPRTFEPACSAEGWERVSEPYFPIQLRGVPSGDGRSVLRFWAGERLPPAKWRRRPAKMRSATQNNRYRAALEEIAAGHNDARARARQALGGASR